LQQLALPWQQFHRVFFPIPGQCEQHGPAGDEGGLKAEGGRLAVPPQAKLFRSSSSFRGQTLAVRAVKRWQLRLRKMVGPLDGLVER
jgi:hypothetical protein